MKFFSIFKRPRINSSIDEWRRFISIAPRSVVEDVYKKFARGYGYEDVKRVLESRLKSFEQPFVSSDNMSNILMVEPYLSNEQLKKWLSAAKEQDTVSFPRVVVEAFGGDKSGRFRGVAVNPELILAGGILIPMEKGEAIQIVQQQKMSLLTVDDVLLIGQKLGFIQQLLREVYQPLQNGLYWIEGKVGDENLVWQLGGSTKFGCCQSVARAWLMAKL